MVQQTTTIITENGRKRRQVHAAASPLSADLKRQRKNESSCGGSSGNVEEDEAELIESLASFGNQIQTTNEERPTTPVGAIGALMDVVQSEIFSMSPGGLSPGGAALMGPPLSRSSPGMPRSRYQQHALGVPESPFTTMAGQVHRPYTLQSPTKSEYLNNNLFPLSSQHPSRSPVRTPPPPTRAIPFTPSSARSPFDKLIMPPLQSTTEANKLFPTTPLSINGQQRRGRVIASPYIHDDFIFDANQLPDHLVAADQLPETPVRTSAEKKIVKASLKLPLKALSPLPRVTPTEENSCLENHLAGKKNKGLIVTPSSSRQQQHVPISPRPTKTDINEVARSLEFRNAALRGGKVAQVLAAAAATQNDTTDDVMEDDSSSAVSTSKHRPLRIVRQRMSTDTSSQELDDDPEEPSTKNTRHRSARPCTCKNSRCLKLYCDCFAAMQVCSSDCSCLSCHNNSKYNKERTEAISNVLKKNKYAFDMTKRVCKCQRSKCLKKYCECFNFGMTCTELCKCVNCANFPGSAELAAKRQGIHPPPTLPRAPPVSLPPEQTAVSANTHQQNQSVTATSDENNQSDRILHSSPLASNTNPPVRHALLSA